MGQFFSGEKLSADGGNDDEQLEFDFSEPEPDTEPEDNSSSDDEGQETGNWWIDRFS